MCALVFLQPCFAFTASHSSLRIRSNAVTQWPSSSSLATTCVALVHFCKAPFSSMHRIIICCHLLCFLSLLISDCRCFDASFDGEPFLQVRCPLVSAAQPFCQTVAILTSLSYFRSRVFICFFFILIAGHERNAHTDFWCPIRASCRQALPRPHYFIFFLGRPCLASSLSGSVNISTRLFSSSLCFQ